MWVNDMASKKWFSHCSHSATPSFQCKPNPCGAIECKLSPFFLTLKCIQMLQKYWNSKINAIDNTVIFKIWQCFQCGNKNMFFFLIWLKIFKKKSYIGISSFSLPFLILILKYFFFFLGKSRNRILFLTKIKRSQQLASLWSGYTSDNLKESILKSI